MPATTPKVQLATALASGAAYRLLPVAPGDFSNTLASGAPVATWATTVGDLNGDGLADLVVGAGSDDDKLPDAGRVFIHMGQASGTDSTVLTDTLSDVVIDGVDSGDLAGAAVGAVADLNGDGVGEVLVGAPGMDHAGQVDAGVGFVLFNPTPGGGIDLGDPYAGDGKGYAIRGAAAGDAAGTAMVGIADLNGDGLAEVLVGAPGVDGPAGADQGAVYLVHGQTDPAGVELSAVAGGVGGQRILGEDGGDAIGSAIGTVADMNGDGRNEVLVGAANHNDGSGSEHRGAAYVVFSGNPAAELRLADVAAGVGGFRVTGALGDDAGAAVAGLGDVNGDGLGDLLVGAARGGHAYVVYGKADGAGVDVASLGAGGLRITAEAAGDLDQMSVAGGADLNRDGVNDLVIGAPGNDEGGSDAGAVYVVWGGGGADVDLADVAQGIGGTKVVGEAGSLLGSSVALSPDLNGDGTADLVLGAAGAGGESVVTLFTPTDWLPQTEVVGTAGDDAIGPGYGPPRHPVGDGNDTILAMAGNDTVSAGGGNDRIDGGTGADSMTGGAGDDLYLVDNAGDTTVEEAGGGQDTVLASIDWTLADHVERLELADGVVRGTGNAQANTLIGNDADNLLDGGAGADTMTGGAGNDTYRVDDASDTVVELAGGGLDTVVASVDYTLSAGSNIELLQADGDGITVTGDAGDNRLLGSAGHQVLVGGDGADQLDGGAGADLLVGGAGDDTYFVDDLGDLVIETADGGLDTVVTAFEGTVADHIENVRLTGSAHAVTGNAGNNTLAGNAGDDTLDGGGGDDLLLGGDGDDVLVSHAGRDTLSGGSGNDTYRVHGGSVYIEDFLGEDTLDASEASGDSHIDLSGDTASDIEGQACDLGHGGTTASPLDLQFLQDLSGSFGDDIANVQALVPQIAGALRTVQANSLFGVSSFIDKAINPFGASGEWVYQQELGLTADENALAGTYNGLVIRYGNDEPEAEIEALMQLALHADQVGFRADSARFVVLFTDAPYHQAGDGLQAGITTPNNGDAVMDGGGIGEDYPLVAQVKAALVAANIIPIFAIANGYESVYQGLVGELGRGAVVTLTTDSSNVVSAITAGLTAATTTHIEHATGGSGNDTLKGDVGDNRLAGKDGHDTLAGNAGSDLLDGGRGNDTLQGGAGDDTAVFTGSWATHDVAVDAAGVLTVSDRLADGSGNDTLDGVEHLQFSHGRFTAAEVVNQGPSAADDAADGLVEAGTAGAGQAVASGQLLDNDGDANLATVGLGETLAVSAARAGAVADSSPMVSVAAAGDTVLHGSYGELTLRSDGRYTYQLDNTRAATEALAEGAQAQDLFSYTLSDAHGATAVAQLAVNITGAADAVAVNHAPTGSASAVLAAGLEDAAYTVTSAQLLQGFSDADGDALSVSGLRSSHGSVSVNADGSFVLTPPANVNGLITLHYDVVDGQGGLTAATQQLTLDAVNDAPTGSASALLATGTAGQPYTVSRAQLLQGFSDVDGDTLDIAGLGATGGTVTLNADGSATIVHAVGDAGPVTLSYQVVDGHGGSTFASLGYVLDAPPSTVTAGTDTLLVTRGLAAVLDAEGLLGNDSAGAAGGSLHVDAVSNAVGASVALVDGQLQVTASAATGSFDYTVSSSAGGTATGHVDFGSVSTDGRANTVSAGPGVTAADLQGQAGNDTLTGGAGADRLLGGAGNDQLQGGAGNDWLDGGAGKDMLIGGLGDDVYLVDHTSDTVIDAGGTDTVLASTSSWSLGAGLENLRSASSGDFKGTGNALDNRLDGGDGNDLLDGAGGADRLYGGAGQDTLQGGAGNDVLHGGLGLDALLGGGGADVFVFDSLADLGRTATTTDRVRDFNHGQGDKIDLSAIDANLWLDGDQAFDFVGSSAFSGHAGELRMAVSRAGLTLSGDVDGDGVADFAVQLVGVGSFTGGDLLP